MKDLLKRHLFIIGLSVFFLAVCTVLICTWFKYQLNPDATSYFTIAQKYAHGDFRHAINGYWGPLLSWLLVPAVWLGVNLIIAAKLIAAFAAIGTLWVVYIFLLNRKVARPIIYCTTAALAVMTTVWVVVEAITPDVLFAFLATLMAVTLLTFMREPSRRHGLALGALGGALYFTKGFGFFFFIGVVGLVALYYWLRVDKNILVVVRRYLPVAGAFLVLVVPFIAIISVKYHGPTINNAGTFDRHIHGYYGAKTANDPPLINTGGPFKPTNDTALSVWEDPTALTPLVPGWSPLDSRDTLHYFVFGTVGKNLNQALRAVYMQGLLFVIGLGALVLGVLQRKHFQREYVVFTFIIALMVAGYALVLIEARYLWTAVVLSALGAALFGAFMQKKKVLSTLQIVAVGLIIICLGALESGQVIAQTRDTGREWLLLSQTLKDDLPSGARIMSDDFARSYHMCYYLDLKCYNVLSPPADDQNNYYALLKKYHVEYVLDFHARDNESALQQFIHDYMTPVTEHTSGANRVTVYRVN